MYEILQQYKDQLKIIREKLKEIDEKMNNYEFEYDPELDKLKRQYFDLDYFKRNLIFGIRWIECGHMSNIYSGVENIHAYDDKGDEYNYYGCR
jgi:hypothetical protein